MRVRTAVAGLAAALALQAAPAAAQARVHRFLVDSVGDSTFVFRMGRGADWLRAGEMGIAVDPRRRDAMVARFRILSVTETRATALITGQTTFVTVDHVALVEEPPTRFYRARSFWAGTLLGALLGAGAALLAGAGG